MPSTSTLAEQETTVLVLDDEEGLADRYATWLADDHAVRTTYTATAARQSFDEAVDIALVDRRLPGESGDALLEWIHERKPRCRLAAVTPAAPALDAVELPFDEYLVEPIDRPQLRDAVQRLETQLRYDEALRELYSLTTKRTHLEAALSESELASSEAYAALQSEITALDRITAEATASFATDDFSAMLRRLDPDAGGGLTNE